MAAAESTSVISVLTYDCCEHLVMLLGGLCQKLWPWPRIEFEHPFLALFSLQNPGYFREAVEFDKPAIIPPYYLISYIASYTSSRSRSPRVRTGLRGRGIMTCLVAFCRKQKSTRSLRESQHDSIPRQSPHHGIDLADLRDTARAQIHRYTYICVRVVSGRGVLLKSAPCSGFRS